MPLVEPGAEEASATPYLPDLPGIDMSEGLQRTGGNPERFSKLVLGFCEGLDGLARTLQGMLEREETSQALERLHSLKGTAGNLGAHRVAASAASLENTLRKTGDWGAQLDLLEVGLMELLESAEALRRRRAVDQVAPPDEEMTVHTSALVPLFAELSGHLVSSNFKAVQTFGEIRKLLAHSPLRAEMESLERRIDKLDFEGALRRVREVAEALGIQEP